MASLRISIARFTSCLPRSLRRLSKRTDGIAAVEFALLVPVMLALFTGIVEFGQAIDASSRVTQVASSTADLITQQTTVTTAQLDGIMQIVQTIMQPYPTGTLKLTATEVLSGPVGNLTAGTVCWNYAFQGGTTNYAAGSGYALPAGVAQAGGSVVVVDVMYTYTGPFYTQYVTPNFPMHERFLLTPRLSGYVKYLPTCP